jgi:hypothetical protein
MQGSTQVKGGWQSTNMQGGRGEQWRERSGRGLRVAGDRGFHASGRLSPSCVILPAASHPGWSVCKLWSCIGTEAPGGMEERHRDLESGSWGGCLSGGGGLTS